MALSAATLEKLSPAQQFLLWGVATLRDDFPVEAAEAAARTLRFDTPAGANTGPYARWIAAKTASDPELLGQVIRRLQAHGDWQHAAPRVQPHSMDHVAAALVSAHDFPAGQVDFVSATVEHRPILRLTFAHFDTAGAPPELRHAYYWHDGEELDDAIVVSLGLDDLTTWPDSLPAQEPQRVRRWIDVCLMRDRKQHLDEESREFVVATLIWCQHLSGKIAFTAGDTTVAIPVAGWAQRLAAGDETPLPYFCPLTGLESRHLGVTSDGRIVPREGLAECDASHSIVLASELETCAATGQRVRRDLLDTCLVTGQRVQRSLLQTCGQCHQPVAPSAVSAGRCSACRSLAPVRSDDPRMARVLGEYPKLDRWRRWTLAETESTYVLATHSLVRQVLLVVHKESLSILYAAVAGRIWSPWQEMSQLQRDDLLG